MTKRNGSPIWMDLSTHDLKGTQAFYSELFGWNFTSQGDDFGGYNMITKDGANVGGAMSSLMGPDGPTEEPQHPTAWTVYLATDDIDAALAKATEQGATVLVPSMPVGPLGFMAILQDPAGAVLGLWQPGEFEGFDLPLTHGTPVWFEGMVPDFELALPFYQDTLDWDVQYMPGEEGSTVRYATHGENGANGAGLCDTSAWGEIPAHWRMYVGVDNTDETLEKLKELGGTVLDGPMDSPFGRLATVADPQGATFQIIQGQR